jgi:hypothetical protein
MSAATRDHIVARLLIFVGPHYFVPFRILVKRNTCSALTVVFVSHVQPLSISVVCPCISYCIFLITRNIIFVIFQTPSADAECDSVYMTDNR